MTDEDRQPMQDAGANAPTQAHPTQAHPIQALPAQEPPTGPLPTQAATTAATAVLPHPRIAPYLQAARHLLADLPEGERAELLDDLDAHLHEILAEEGEAFEARLGAPDAYATEFRASAGYPPAVGGTEAARRRSWVVRVARRSADFGVGVSEAAAQRMRGLPGGPALLALLPRLRPAWWVLRAWLVAVVLGVDWPTSQYSGTGWWGAIAWQLTLVVASVAWGLRTERRAQHHAGRGRRLEQVALGTLNTFAVACCILAVLGVSPLVRSQVTSVDEPVAVELPEQTGLWLDGAPVTNLVAYDLSGQPIEGFQLFTGEGDPVTIDENEVPGLDDAWVHPVPVTTSNGTPVANVFPIRRVEVGDVDEYYCVTATWEGPCDPSAMATVQGEQPAPVGSPWKDLTVTPVPAVGSTVPLDVDWNPIWSGIVAPQAGSPSSSPSPTAQPSVSATTKSGNVGQDQESRSPSGED